MHDITLDRLADKARAFMDAFPDGKWIRYAPIPERIALDSDVFRCKLELEQVYVEDSLRTCIPGDILYDMDNSYVINVSGGGVYVSRAFRYNDPNAVRWLKVCIDHCTCSAVMVA